MPSGSHFRSELGRVVFSELQRCVGGAGLLVLDKGLDVLRLGESTLGGPPTFMELRQVLTNELHEAESWGRFVVWKSAWM